MIGQSLAMLFKEDFIQIFEGKTVPVFLQNANHAQQVLLKTRGFR